MRQSLQDITEQGYWVYGLSVDDYDYTIRLAKEFADAKLELLKQEANRARREHPNEADDIMDDITYYTHTDNEYIWHFCLWRLQAIFEGIIVHKLLRNSGTERLPGLKAKLDGVRDAGFRLNEGDYNELLAWAKLRNALSHAPPEQYRPGPLQETDVLEYKALVERLSRRWLKESSSHDVR